MSPLVQVALVVLMVERAGGFGLPANLPSTFYFSCRHTFEDTLSEELRRCGSRAGAATVIAPGLLRVAEFTADAWHGDWDLTYALQALPHAHAVIAPGASISQLAAEAIEAVGLAEGGARVDALRSAPKGALAIHALVPDQVYLSTPAARRWWVALQACVYVCMHTGCVSCPCACVQACFDVCVFVRACMHETSENEAVAKQGHPRRHSWIVLVPALPAWTCTHARTNTHLRGVVGV
jgi:hypothetical protein